MGWPQITFASKLEINDGDMMVVERETDTGSETIEAALPAVVTCDLRLNEPRYATLPNIMKAKKKPVDTIDATEIDVDLAPQNTVLEVMEPPPRKDGIMVESVDDLIAKLRTEAKVIR